MVEGKVKLTQDNREHFWNIKGVERTRVEKFASFLYVLSQDKQM